MVVYLSNRDDVYFFINKEAPNDVVEQSTKLPMFAISKNYAVKIPQETRNCGLMRNCFVSTIYPTVREILCFPKRETR